MDGPASLVLATCALLLATHVVLRPEVYRRRTKDHAFGELLRLTGHDRAVAERLIASEIERGALSRMHAARAAAARLLRDRAR